MCDLENSVQLSERLDPEELREVLAAYQQVCATVTRRYEGYIARYFGDGILVYYGYPTAHEDEAVRAVRTGLGIVEAVDQLNTRLERDHDVRLRCRVGIHTGVVVAGDIAPGAGLETMAVIGETPNIAARLQALAAADSVVVSSSTYHLIAGYFNCHELGFKTLKGISQPMAIYAVLNESGARTRLDVAAVRGLTPMIGREAELAVLAQRWRRAADSREAGVVLVTGEPGIGKSRLIWALTEHVAQSPEATLVRASCSPFFQNTAFYPVVSFLEEVLLDFEPSDSVDQRLDKIEGYLTQMGASLPDAVPLLCELLSVPFQGRYAELNLPADRRRQLTIDALVQLLETRAEQQPLLFVVEDLHWVDPSSMDYLTQVIERLRSARLLTVLSTRPDVDLPVLNNPHVEHLALNRLDSEASAFIVTQIAGMPLPAELMSSLLGKADGVPLYLEELTKLVVELGLLRQEDGHFELAGPIPQLAIPATLADSLTARLDRLSGAKGVAQLGATIGRQFSFDLIASVLRAMHRLDEPGLARDLDRLVDAGMLLVQQDSRGATYSFKHALIQDAAYESLLRSTRQQYHEQIAHVFAKSGTGVDEADPELLAYHYTQAGLTAEAIPLWLRAGQRALRASANPEAIAHLTIGLELVMRLPPSVERTQQELQFRLSAGPALMATRGYGAAEVEACYARARELCRDLGDPPPVAPVLYGLWSYHIVRAQHHTALELGQEILEIGTAAHDTGLIIEGSKAVGWSCFFLGRLDRARENFERVLELYDEEQHGSHTYTFGDHPWTSAAGCLSQVLWLQGYPEQAIRLNSEVVARIRTLNHPYSAAFGLDVASFVQVNLGDASTVRAFASEVISVSREHSLPLTGSMGLILEGWALNREGNAAAGIAQMEEGLAWFLRTSAELANSYWYWLLAEAKSRSGAIAEALELLDRAEQAAERSDERYWEPEIHRLRGKLLSLVPDHSGRKSAEPHLKRALDLARGVGARALELRASIELARFWQGQDRDEEAKQLIQSTLAAFTEGHSTADLQEAHALLEELGGASQLAATVA